MFTPQDLLKVANRDSLLGNTTIDDQLIFLEEQIQDPFNSGDGNYFKKLPRMVSSQDELDEHCRGLLAQIQDVYPHLGIDISDYDQHLSSLFSAIYKFFVKNTNKQMYIFIREFLFNNKNRKTLTNEFSNSKSTVYPKEQFGKKEFYVLITRLPDIMDEVFDGLKMKEFIKYLDRSDSGAPYLDILKDALSDGLIIDNGVMEDMYSLWKRCDRFRGYQNKLEMDITSSLILPYLKENNMLSVNLPPVDEPEEELEDDDEED